MKARRLRTVRRPRPAALRAFPLPLLLASVLIAGCGGSSPATGGKLTVVAAESSWGSIAGQLAGSKASVQSVISNPASDPHSYEPTPADARAFADARLVILNGIGYDPWATRLLDANPVQGRVVLNVGRLLRLHAGDNPHRWYDPADVERVAAVIAADLQRLDRPDADHFAARLKTFLARGLARYHELIATIRSRYAGVAVGASESIFEALAPSLGLEVVTPGSFMKANTEGTEPSARDIATAEHQLTTGPVKLWIYNAQNATPQIQHLNALARQHHIAIATITETLTPASTSFASWQVSQLERIASGLHQATGR